MTDPTPDLDTGAGQSRGSTTGMPRWVKVSLIIVAALILLVVVLNLIGVAPGDHGPSRHIPGGVAEHTR